MKFLSTQKIQGKLLKALSWSKRRFYYFPFLSEKGSGRVGGGQTFGQTYRKIILIQTKSRHFSV